MALLCGFQNKKIICITLKKNLCHNQVLQPDIASTLSEMSSYQSKTKVTKKITHFKAMENC
jgi:hypothetical protein